MGVVEAVGSEAAEHVSASDRVVIPFNISSGHCWMCDRGLLAQCETTQNYPPHRLAGRRVRRRPEGRFGGRVRAGTGGTVRGSDRAGPGAETVIGIDLVDERLELAYRYGVTTLDLREFDKGIQVRMGQCHVKRWIHDILPYVLDDADPLGTLDLATHRISLDETPEAHATFQRTEDGMVKAIIRP